MAGAILNNISDAAVGAVAAVNPANAWAIIGTPFANRQAEKYSAGMFGNLASASASGTGQIVESEQTRQKRIASMQNSLAQLSTGELANLDTSTPNKNVAQNLVARRDTILTQRQTPGRAQTILANINNRAI